MKIAYGLALTVMALVCSTAKAADEPVTVPATQIGLPITAYPKGYNYIIDPSMDKATITTGLMGGHHTVFATFYTHKRVVQMVEDAYVPGTLFGKKLAVEKGALGFETLEAPTHGTTSTPERTMCFFAAKSWATTDGKDADPYKFPWCFIETRLPDGRSKLRHTLAYTNLPVGGKTGLYGDAVVAAPVNTDLKIDHEFDLRLMFTRAGKNKLHYQWLSNTTIAYEGWLPLSNGKAEIRFPHGLMTVEPVGEDQFRVTYIETATPASAAAAIPGT